MEIAVKTYKDQQRHLLNEFSTTKATLYLRNWSASECFSGQIEAVAFIHYMAIKEQEQRLENIIALTPKIDVMSKIFRIDIENERNWWKKENRGFV